MGQGIRAGQTVSSVPYGFDRYGRPLRTWRRRKDLSLGEGFRYPLVDGSGIALMVLLPPFLAIMALPVFDLIVRFTPENALSPVNLLIIPFSVPLVVSFTLTIGYVLLFFGRVLTSSSHGEVDHPRFPIWDRLEILEEIFRWAWAGLVGLVIGGGPLVLFWRNRSGVEWLDWPALVLLGIAGMAYAQMAWMTALLHDQVAAANPVGVVRSIGRVGRGYLGPCLVTASACFLDLAAWRAVLLHSPNVGLGLVGLWACWIFTFYLAMMVIRTLGTLYYSNELKLAWFKTWKG
jgi:hypothetical protein